MRHDSEVQGGGKVAVRGEEVKPTTTAGNMREGERCRHQIPSSLKPWFFRDLPMPDQEFEMELENWREEEVGKYLSKSWELGQVTENHVINLSRMWLAGKKGISTMLSGQEFSISTSIGWKSHLKRYQGPSSQVLNLHIYHIGEEWETNKYAFQKGCFDWGQSATFKLRTVCHF